MDWRRSWEVLFSRPLEAHSQKKLTFIPPPISNKFWMTYHRTQSGDSSQPECTVLRKSKIVESNDGNLPGTLEVGDRIGGSFLLWWCKDDADWPISLSWRKISDTLASCVDINADTSQRCVFIEIYLIDVYFWAENFHENYKSNDHDCNLLRSLSNFQFYTYVLSRRVHTVKYQFDRPFELNFSRKDIFWSTVAHQGWIGCASWLVTQKDNVGNHFSPCFCM